MKDKYEKALSKNVKLSLVKQVMRNELDMRYCRMVKLAPLANKERCRVQRQ